MTGISNFGPMFQPKPSKEFKPYVPTNKQIVNPEGEKTEAQRINPSGELEAREVINTPEKSDKPLMPGVRTGRRIPNLTLNGNNIPNIVVTGSLPFSFGNTVYNKDGSVVTTKTTTQTKPDGTKIENTTVTERQADGTKTVTETITETSPDGTVVTTTKTDITPGPNAEKPEVETYDPDKDGIPMPVTYGNTYFKEDGTRVGSQTTIERKPDGTTIEKTKVTESQGSNIVCTIERTTETRPDGSVTITETKVERPRIEKDPVKINE